jgi:HPt (histidine-containing phosphotransfer) domain-containing protein
MVAEVQLAGARGHCVSGRPSHDSARMAFDGTQLSEIRSALGHDRLDRLLHLFIGELQERPAAIRACADLGNVAGVENQAHSLQGAAYSIGGVLVGAAARQVEDDAGSGESLLPALAALEVAVAQTLAELHLLTGMAPLAQLVDS